VRGGEHRQHEFFNVALPTANGIGLGLRFAALSLRRPSLRRCLQQEYEGKQESDAHRNDSCGMPTVVAFDRNR
jgi:hypothetical protein